MSKKALRRCSRVGGGVPETDVAPERRVWVVEVTEYRASGSLGESLLAMASSDHRQSHFAAPSLEAPSIGR